MLLTQARVLSPNLNSRAIYILKTTPTSLKPTCRLVPYRPKCEQQRLRLEPRCGNRWQPLISAEPDEQTVSTLSNLCFSQATLLCACGAVDGE